MKVYWQNDDGGGSGRPAGLPYRFHHQYQGFGREAQNGTPDACAPAGAVQPDANVISMVAWIENDIKTEITK
jgi:hypothetical protein